MGKPTELIWGVMALYKTVVGQVRTLEGVSELFHTTIGVSEAGMPTLPYFGMYVDEVSDYIERGSDRERS